MNTLTWVKTGFDDLDQIIHGLRKGDNVVWQIDTIEDYFHFVTPFVETALKNHQKVVYIRFGRHKPLVKAKKNLTVYSLNAYRGFESFTSKIHSIIQQEGQDVFYVFDCLSDLLSAWATDSMISNFFVVTCPFLFELNTVAYFSILRNRHSHKTIARIRETTQLLLDLYHCNGEIYLHPLKVWNRYSPTMFLPHVKDKQWIPITNSSDAANLFAHIYREDRESTKRNLDYWDQTFLEAEKLLKQRSTKKQKSKMIDHLCFYLTGQDQKITELTKSLLSLEDLIEIKNRMIGTGAIGGKSVGMLIARKILSMDHSIKGSNILEPHDSFYIGSDVFYSYIVQNGWWKLFMRQRTKSEFFSAAAELREKISEGTFPDDIKDQFYQIIEYFGQSPIIVRSSSLLEDSYGNAFAGKYESIFCANQGTPEQRYQQFEEAVRKIYASAMNENALTYRLQKGLDQQIEQMALLVQRVSGSYKKHFFFPDIAGVGVSYNPFVWKKTMDPKAGMVRLVLGLGTRAVNRVEGDYPRIAALDVPLQKTHHGIEDTRKFSQHDMDVLNIQKNILETVPLKQLLDEGIKFQIEKFAIPDELETVSDKKSPSWIVTFDQFLSDSDFVSIMQKTLKILEKTYQYPVEIEFTANFKNPENFQINLLQCRPFHASTTPSKKVHLPTHLSREKILFQSESNFMGGSTSQKVDRVIYVDPKKYSELALSQKYDIARLIGKLNRKIIKNEPTLIIGPGRWGTTTPSMGVPVNFAEINNFNILVELSFQEGNLMPELSFGTHFFHDLVETNTFYIALFLEEKNVFFNKDLVRQSSNTLAELLPDYKQYADAVKVINFKEKKLLLTADVINQKVICAFSA